MSTDEILAIFIHDEYKYLMDYIAQRIEIWEDINDAVTSELEKIRDIVTIIHAKKIGKEYGYGND